jgi:hypothetical protein
MRFPVLHVPRNMMTENHPKPPLFDPNFCEKRCPVCTRARRGNRLAKFLMTLEMVITWGGCPWGRARRRKYGVRPQEPLPKGDE